MADGRTLKRRSLTIVREENSGSTGDGRTPKRRKLTGLTTTEHGESSATTTPLREGDSSDPPEAYAGIQPPGAMPQCSQEKVCQKATTAYGTCTLDPSLTTTTVHVRGEVNQSSGTTPPLRGRDFYDPPEAKADFHPPAAMQSQREPQCSQEEVREEPTTGDEELSAAACVEAYRRLYGDLITAIQDPEVVAARLFSQHVVSDAVLEEVCAPTLTPIRMKTRLLSAVKSQIAVNPKAFGLLLQVLKMEPYLMDMAHRLEQTYQKCKSEPSVVKLQQPTQPVGISISLDQPQRPNAMATYASYLRSVYLRQKLPTYGKFPHSPSRKYTNLASVKKEPLSKAEADAFTRATIHDGIDVVARKKEPITMKEIAVVKEGVWPNCILVEGAPGVGKSTFAWKMCRQWGKGKILRDYKLVVLLSLREKKVREATQVRHLFHFYNSEVQEKVAREVERTGGIGVLLLFEGYDELPETLRTQDSLFLDIIRGKELPLTTVLITSRPSASGFLYEECKDYLSQHIEILGFTSGNVQSYLESTCSKDSDLLSGIQKYLQCYPHIRTMMYVPLNAAIVVEVYRTSKKDQSVVPRTMTQLYECLVRSLLRRYLNDHPVHGKRKWRIRTFDDLPQDVYTQLCELGRIAFKGIVGGQQVIFDDLPEDFVTLSLMQCVPELYVDEGAAVSHSFLHLTIQEFMAAFHLSRHPVEEQLDDEVQNKHKMVMRFLAGLTRHEGKTIGTSDTGELELEVDGLHLMFEAQRVADILKPSEVIIDNEDFSHFDNFVLGYCISHSNSSWYVTLECSSEGIEVEELVNGALEHPVQSRGRISELRIYGPRPSDELISSHTVKHLLKLPKHMFLSSLEILEIVWTQISAEITTLLQQTTALKQFSYPEDHEHIGTVEQCRAVASGLRTNDTLTWLLLPQIIDPEGIEYLAGALQENTTLQGLDMSYSTVDVAGATALGNALTINTSLQELDVWRCDIDSDGARQLANALHVNTSLQELNLPKNPIGTTGATALAEALTVNTSLRKLNIAVCDIDSEGACRLAGALHTNSTLQKLNMSWNPIGDTGATALAEALTVNTSLKKLNIYDRSVGEQGTHAVLSSLAQNTTLEKLVLHDDDRHIISSYPVRDTIKINTVWWY